MDGEYYKPSVDLDQVLKKVTELKLKSSLRPRARAVYLSNPTEWKATYIMPWFARIDDKVMLEKGIDYLKENKYNIRIYFDHLVKNSGRAPEVEELPAEMVSLFCKSMATGSIWTEMLKKPIPEFNQNLLNGTFRAAPAPAILHVLKMTKQEWPECLPILMKEGYSFSYCEIFRVRVKSVEEWLYGQVLDGLAAIREGQDYTEMASRFFSTEGHFCHEYIRAVQSKLPWLEEVISKNKKVFDYTGLGETLYRLMESFTEKPIRDY